MSIGQDFFRFINNTQRAVQLSTDDENFGKLSQFQFCRYLCVSFRFFHGRHDWFHLRGKQQ